MSLHMKNYFVANAQKIKEHKYYYSLQHIIKGENNVNHIMCPLTGEKIDCSKSKRTNWAKVWKIVCALSLDVQPEDWKNTKGKK